MSKTGERIVRIRKNSSAQSIQNALASAKAQEYMDLRPGLKTRQKVQLAPSDGGVPASRSVVIEKGDVEKRGDDLYVLNFFNIAGRSVPEGASKVKVMGQEMLHFRGALDTCDIKVVYSSQEPPFKPRKF